jgi:hypothetical protein
MAGEIDFRALSPGMDYGGFLASLQAGERNKMARATTALEVQRLERQAAQDKRETDGNESVARYFESLDGGGAPAASPAAAMPDTAPNTQPALAAPAMAAPQDAPQPGEITVTANREPPKPSPTRFLADIARSGQGQLAMQLWEKTRQMSKEERDNAVAAYDAMDSAFATLATVPYEQRKPLIAQLAPGLIARGVPEATIANFDPTDDAVTAARNNALGIKGLLEQQDKAADNARGDRQLALTERGQDITLRGQDMSRGNAQIVAGSFGKPPSGYRYKADGNLEAIPGGPAAATSKQLTETQAKATGLYRAAAEAARTMNGVSGYNPSLVANALDTNNVAATGLGQTERRVLNAQRAFANAVLRLESGAAITPAEINEKARTLFPAPGDGPEAVADKARLRGQSLAALRDAAGRGVAGLAPVQGGAAPTKVARGTLSAPVNGVRTWTPGGSR